MQVEIKTSSGNYFVNEEDFKFLKYYQTHQNLQDLDYERYNKIVGNLITAKLGSEPWGDEDEELWRAVDAM